MVSIVKKKPMNINLFITFFFTTSILHRHLFLMFKIYKIGSIFNTNYSSL